MNIKELVIKQLKSDGYDGLYSRLECACLLDDLMPCGQSGDRCTAGYKKECDGSSDGCPCDFHVVDEK